MSKHRCFEVVTPAGRVARIHGDPKMPQATLEALMHMMDLAYQQISAVQGKEPSMQIKREEDNHLFTLIAVKPWPDEPWAASVTVLQEKRDTETGATINHVQVRYGSEFLPIAVAREWANAILKACDLAGQLERDGAVVLDGEEQAG